MNGEVSRNEKVKIHNLKNFAVCSTEVSEFAKISAGRGVGEERNVKCQLLTVASRWTIWAISGYGGEHGLRRVEYLTYTQRWSLHAHKAVYLSSYTLYEVEISTYGT